MGGDDIAGIVLPDALVDDGTRGARRARPGFEVEDEGTAGDESLAAAGTGADESFWFMG